MASRWRYGRRRHALESRAFASIDNETTVSLSEVRTGRFRDGRARVQIALLMLAIWPPDRQSASRRCCKTLAAGRTPIARGPTGPLYASAPRRAKEPIHPSDGPLARPLSARRLVRRPAAPEGSQEARAKRLGKGARRSLRRAKLWKRPSLEAPFAERRSCGGTEPRISATERGRRA